jgi:uncharacterized tellurite resistance protein B-like protein
MELLDKFTNLLVMAAADGSLTEREIKFLLNRSARWGISEREFSRAMEYALSEKAELKIAADRAQRTAMLQDLIRVMAADGDLAEIEKRLFATAAAKMRLSDEELNAIINSAIGDARGAEGEE